MAEVVILDGSATPERDAVGGKAWSLARMAALGLRVPPAFVITTEACREYFEAERVLPHALEEGIAAGVAWLERETGRQLGGESPLLLSVRSGAAVSMPGMMDTVLDLGMNDGVERALAAETGDTTFAADTHRRFCELFGRIVLKVTTPAEATSARAIRAAVRAECGEEIPAEPREQLRRAVVAVFESSRSRRARAYKKHHGLPDELATAVTVQAMVFGNLDDRSGTGVLFTRNPLSGDDAPYGEVLARAQGEDVVSGTKRPQPLEALRRLLPEVHDELLDGARVLEREERDVQDVEFTIERGRLYFLQTRTAKRSAPAAVRIAADLATAGCISPEEAVARLTVEQVESLLHPRLGAAARARAEVIARGEPASPGIGQGVVVEDCDEAERRAERGEAIVLARPTTSPDDVHGMIASVAVVTELGGTTSHAAVVGRQLGKPCIVGCGAGVVGRIVGRDVTVDGESGEVFAGRLELEVPSESDHPDLSRLSALLGGRPLTEILARGSAPGGTNGAE